MTAMLVAAAVVSTNLAVLVTGGRVAVAYRRHLAERARTTQAAQELEDRRRVKCKLGNDGARTTHELYRSLANIPAHRGDRVEAALETLIALGEVGARNRAPTEAAPTKDVVEYFLVVPSNNER